jgi:hypothetical protein
LRGGHGFSFFEAAEDGRSKEAERCADKSFFQFRVVRYPQSPSRNNTKMPRVSTARLPTGLDFSPHNLASFFKKATQIHWSGYAGAGESAVKD